jgi:hypothetical protein
VGPENRSQYVPGAPAGDLTEDEYQGLPKDVQKAVDASGLYEGADLKQPEPTEPLYGTEKRPLSYFEGKSDEEILAEPGIGDKTLAEIRAALGAR